MTSPFKKVHKMAFLLKKIPGKLYRGVDDKLRRSTVKIRSANLKVDNFFDFKPKCIFMIDDQNKEQYINKIEEWHRTEEIIEGAEKLSHHIFNLLGSGESYLGDKIDWNTDFKTGFKWRNQYYKDIHLVDLANQADVKVVWELSRFQHLVTLGKAYWISQDEKYAIEFGKQIEDWHKSNPVEFSVNWTCAMDVAIRAVNWITAYYFFKDSPSLNPIFWAQFHKSLYQHGKFIKSNLENRGMHQNNHYIADLVGLIWLGLYFGDHYVQGEAASNNPKVWLVMGVMELEKEMKLQVNRDGTDYELTTSYHRLVTEMFLLTTIFSVKNGIFYSRMYCNRLKKMVRFLMRIMKPNGLTPLVGDADDGRLLILGDYFNWDKQDFRYVLAMAGEFFEKDEWRLGGLSCREEALWAVGSWHSPEKPARKPESAAFRQGGFYLLQNERFYCLIRCGELSCRGDGGHSHNDQLSIIFSAGQTDLIIDPGLYVYSANFLMRNIFRSTNSHNTLCIEGAEQNDFQSSELFAMPEQSNAKCVTFDGSSFTGRHYGYQKKMGLIHQRTVGLIDNGLVLEDSLIGEPPKGVEWYLNLMLAPDLQVIINDADIQIKKDAWLVTLVSSEKLDVKIINGYSSKGYGLLETTKRLIIRNGIPEAKSLTLKILCQECPQQMSLKSVTSDRKWSEVSHDNSSWAIS